MKPLKAAILGYGRSGSSLHAQPLDALADFNVVAVCDIDPAATDKATARFGCKIYTDYHEMLANEELDLVVIVTRSDQHAQMACDCMVAGKNVLVTKPWAVNSGEAYKMIATAAATGKKLLPWLPARWGCDLVAIKRIVESGAIGKLFQVKRGVYTFGRRSDWQIESKFGGGYLLNWGPHLVDQPLQLTNAPVVSVYAELKQLINPGDVEDNFYTIVKTADGITFISEFGIAAPGMPDWIIQGDAGTIFVRGVELEIHRATFPDQIDKTDYRGQVTLTKSVETAGDPRYVYGDAEAIYRHIAAALRDEVPYAITLESALRVSRIFDAAKASSRTGHAIFL